MIDLVAVLHHALVVQGGPLQLRADGRVDDQLFGVKYPIQIFVHFFIVCYAEQHVAARIILTFGQAQISCTNYFPAPFL